MIPFGLSSFCCGLTREGDPCMPALLEIRAADCPCCIILNLTYSYQIRLEHRQHGSAAGLSQHPSGDTDSIPWSKSSLTEL